MKVQFFYFEHLVSLHDVFVQVGVVPEVGAVDEEDEVEVLEVGGSSGPVQAELLHQAGLARAGPPRQ